MVMFGGNFASRNWALCEGQLLAIAQDTMLFSLLGTLYEGHWVALDLKIDPVVTNQLKS